MTQNNKPDILLGDSHRSGISTTLWLLDRMLCETEEYACGREVHSIFYIERNTLSADKKANLLSEISQMRDLIKELKSGLGLEAQIEDIGRKIWGKFSLFWEVLMETTGRYLKRYGEPPPGLAEYLDPRIEVLIRHLQNIRDLARGNDQEEH
jgi:hypothetical protein